MKKSSFLISVLLGVLLFTTSPVLGDTTDDSSKAGSQPGMFLTSSPQVRIMDNKLELLTIQPETSQVQQTGKEIVDGGTIVTRFISRASFKIMLMGKQLDEQETNIYSHLSQKDLMTLASMIGYEEGWDWGVYCCHVSITQYYDEVQLYQNGGFYRFDNFTSANGTIIWLDSGVRAILGTMQENCYGRAYSRPDLAYFIGVRNNNQTVQWQYPTGFPNHWLYDGQSFWYDTAPSQSSCQTSWTVTLQRGTSAPWIACAAFRRCGT
ncbi:MAG: hypothetical protein NTV14_06975 [Coprothermobacterota bacterium]|nr:hypothetical protein [Coprothermobacterota bacterium]